MTSPATAPLQPERQSPALLLLRRFWGVALRHIYLHLGSWPRIVEMMYWPMVNIASWGFMSLYLTRRFTHVEAMGSAIVAAVVLMEIFLRPAMMALTLFMEEMWSRNLGHLFASPITMPEYAVSLLSVTLMRTSIALIPMLILAATVFGFSLFSLGWPLLAYIPILALNGCLYGLMIISILLRYGLAAEWLAWMATWFLVPFFAPYFPVSILPAGLQVVSRALPPTYIFESMKSVIDGGDVLPGNLLIALGLTVLYGLLAAFLFWKAYQNARQRGGLLQSGE